ncbi:unnamed protein product, partial [Mesorhabditis spiculigera]
MDNGLFAVLLFAAIFELLTLILFVYMLYAGYQILRSRRDKEACTEDGRAPTCSDMQPPESEAEPENCEGHRNAG